MFDVYVKSSENESQYLWRLGQAKDAGLLQASWYDIANLMNTAFGNPNKTESAWRRLYNCAKKFVDDGVFSLISGENMSMSQNSNNKQLK